MQDFFRFYACLPAGRLEGGYDLLFPDDENDTIECENCGRVIRGSEKVEWVDKERKIFKCPECDKGITIE